ncbi:hypothetical protein QYF61_001357 [Mycteria americana]|uniref:ribonuclease H n=1 Tax=Mycteria americana TaxID=33587 RepID=A0AAN7MXI4_MYCAM|nr:hypothetical protein QYF61_001357 [Mycteria americana]
MKWGGRISVVVQMGAEGSGKPAVSLVWDGPPQGSLNPSEASQIKPVDWSGTTCVRKPDGWWRLAIDYRKLNSNTPPLMAAVPNITSLVTARQAAAHPRLAALDAKDMFFMIPPREEDKSQFAFTWEGTQYTFNQLPQGYKQSPTIAHNTLAALLDTVKVPLGVHIYQYLDDILVGGDNKVGQVADTIWNLLTDGLDIPPSKCQGPGQEIKFLGAWWIAGAIMVPDDVLLAIEGGQTLNSKTELQHLLGTLG